MPHSLKIPVKSGYFFKISYLAKTFQVHCVLHVQLIAKRPLKELCLTLKELKPQPLLLKDMLQLFNLQCQMHHQQLAMSDWTGYKYINIFL